MTRDLRPFYAWYGDMTLVGHLWNVFKLGGFTVDVIFHSPVTADAFAGRKELARYCHQQVARGIEQCLTGRDFTLPGEMLQLPVPA
jgi:1-acyl-sn-glycerol-3-phosphate acyltransferase